MRSKDFYTVKLNDIDISLQVKDFTTGRATLPLTTADSLHVGYYKPFRNLYIDFSVLNTTPASITVEYFNGSDWAELPEAINETEGFTRSGFVYFEAPSDWKKIAVADEDNFYIRFRTDTDLELTTEINGISVMLCNDEDIIGIRSNIVSKHNNGETWIKKHEAAKKHIIQKLRNLGHRKVERKRENVLNYPSNETLYYSKLTAFDLLDPFELREAAKFYALSFIYLDELSDEIDDKWQRNGKRHENRADDALNVYMLRFDKDNDGIEDPEENEGSTGTSLTWV